MVAPESIRISVVYALPARQVIVEVDVSPGTSVADSVAASGLLDQFPEIASRPLACAIYGRAVRLASSVREGDRIEILRPLPADPKESRRQAAKAGRTVRRSG